MTYHSSSNGISHSSTTTETITKTETKMRLVKRELKASGVMCETDEEIFTQNGIGSGSGEKAEEFLPLEIKWPNLIALGSLHLASVYALKLIFMDSKWQTNLFCIFLATIVNTCLGVTAGPHRLWTHRSYKATLPLRIFLMIAGCITAQTPIFNWVRYHRVHHRYTETNADPHNAKRGLFFSHCGWLICKQHPDVVEKMKTEDLSDIRADKVVMFQKKYFYQMALFLSVLMPTMVPVHYWGESVWNAFFICVLFRGAYALNIEWLVNSVAHTHGNKPYDRNISPTDHQDVSFATCGEGWHNYHHVYPWDYKAAELPQYKYNLTTAFIDLMAKLGLAYDLKSVSDEVITNRAHRTGDGSRGKESHEVEHVVHDPDDISHVNPWYVTAFCYFLMPQMWAVMVAAPIVRELCYTVLS